MPDKALTEADLKALEDALGRARRQIDEAAGVLTGHAGEALRRREDVNTGCSCGTNTGCSCSARTEAAGRT